MTTTNPCPCGSADDYEECCAPVHHGTRVAETAEALLRSRYAAFVKGKVEYLVESAHHSIRDELDQKNLREWATQSTWHGLEILATHQGGPEDDQGLVEFVAHYDDAAGEHVDHHERALFQKEDGRWFFVDGEPGVQEPYRREAPKLGRNDPCHCGSGKKFKKCHGRAA